MTIFCNRQYHFIPPILLGVAVLSVIGCSLWQQQQNPVQVPIATSTAETATTTIDTSTWKTYRNEEYGFEFKYPGNLPDPEMWDLSSVGYRGPYYLRITPYRNLPKQLSLNDFALSLTRQDVDAMMERINQMDDDSVDNHNQIRGIVAVDRDHSSGVVYKKFSFFIDNDLFDIMVVFGLEVLPANEEAVVAIVNNISNNDLNSLPVYLSNSIKIFNELVSSLAIKE